MTRSFARIHRRSCEFVLLPAEGTAVYKALADRIVFMRGMLLRSAAAVEQTSGGISARLWDDPFEWTLPEELTTLERILNYLNEVRANTEKAFAYFAFRRRPCARAAGSPDTEADRPGFDQKPSPDPNIGRAERSPCFRSSPTVRCPRSPISNSLQCELFRARIRLK